MHMGEDWLRSVEAGILSVQTLYGAERARSAVIIMSPLTASRGLLICGMTDIRELEERIGRRIYLDVSMPDNEYLILDGERLGKSAI